MSDIACIDRYPVAWTSEDTRLKLEVLEDEMRKRGEIDVNCSLKHYFTLGVYAREITLPAKSLVTGKIHRFEHIIILSKGDATVLIGNEVRRIQAPYTILSPSGTKRIIYSHEETVWTAIHGTFDRKLSDLDLNEVEHAYVAQTNAEYVDFARAIDLERVCAARMASDADELRSIELVAPPMLETEFQRRMALLPEGDGSWYGQL